MPLKIVVENSDTLQISIFFQLTKQVPKKVTALPWLKKRLARVKRKK